MKIQIKKMALFYWNLRVGADVDVFLFCKWSLIIDQLSNFLSVQNLKF